MSIDLAQMIAEDGGSGNGGSMAKGLDGLATTGPFRLAVAVANGALPPVDVEALGQYPIAVVPGMI